LTPVYHTIDAGFVFALKFGAGCSGSNNILGDNLTPGSGTFGTFSPCAPINNTVDTCFFFVLQTPASFCAFTLGFHNDIL